MSNHFLEIAGIKVKFCPTHLTMTIYTYNEIEEILVLKSIEELKTKYRALLKDGYKVFDPNEIIGTKPILENTPEQDAMIQAEIEAMESEEFFTPKPDDWAYK